MTDIEKIIDKFDVELRPGYLSDSSQHIIKIMKEYAELYAGKCLSIAAKNAKIDYKKMDHHLSLYQESIDLESITNINLPEHT